MNKKTKMTTIIAGAATTLALVFSTLLSQYNIQYDTKTSYDYSIEKSSDYVSVLTVNSPVGEGMESLPIQSATLVLNDQQIETSSFDSSGNCAFHSVPLVFSDMSNLYIEGYFYDKVFTLGKFEGNKVVWYYNADTVNHYREEIKKINNGGTKDE